MVEHCHIKPACSPRDLTTDIAHPNDTDRGMMHFISEHVPGIIVGECRATRVVIAGHYITRSGQEQCERHISGSAVENMRRIPNWDAARKRGIEVDLVNTNAKVTDDLQVRH